MFQKKSLLECQLKFVEIISFPHFFLISAQTVLKEQVEINISYKGLFNVTS